MSGLLLLPVVVALLAVDPQAAPPSPDPSTLTALVAELERNNPELQAGRREIDMRHARVAPAGALPDPILSVSSMSGFSRPPFFPSSATPDAFRLISFSQEIPYPGKRSLRSSVAAADVDAERSNFDDRRRQLVAELKTAYLDYVLAVRSLEILTENRLVLNQLREIAEARFSVGKGVQQDVIKAQLELSTLRERQTVLEQQRAGSIARLNALLARPAGGQSIAIGYTTAPMPQDLGAFEAQIDTAYPAIQRDARLIEKSQRTLALSRKELRPDFRVGVSAQRYTGDMPWMYGLDLMVSLPIYASAKQRPMIQEAAAALDVSERTRDNHRRQATAEVTQAFLAATAADQVVNLYADSVLPQSKLALESSLAAYQVGSVDFLSVLTSFQAVLAAQVSRVEQQTRRDQALVRLERFVAIEFVK